MSWHGFFMKDMSSSGVFHKIYVEIILTYFFTITLRGIGQGLSDAIMSSFKLLLGVH